MNTTTDKVSAHFLSQYQSQILITEPLQFLNWDLFSFPHLDGNARPPHIDERTPTDGPDSELVGREVGVVWTPMDVLCVSLGEQSE